MNWSVALVIIAPLVWLMMLQTGYLLSHWACGTGMKWPVQIVTFGAVVVLAGVLLAWRPWFLSESSPTGAAGATPSFLATVAFWLVAGMLLVAIASSIEPLIVPPCG